MTEQEQARLRREILAKPASVQIVIKMIAVKLSIDDYDESDEHLAMWMYRAIARWNELKREVVAAGMSEAEAASEAILILRKTPDSVWGRILRGNAN